MKNNLPKVVVLLAAYNGMRWIDEQINTILGQQGVDIELFISVDLSTDGTYEWCQDLERREDCVTVLPYGERFGIAAKNFYRLIREVDLSVYDFVSFADQDDVWLPSKLSHAADVLQKDGVNAYSSDVIAFWEDGREQLLEKSQPQKKIDYFFEAAGPGCTYFFKSDALQQFKDFLTLNWNVVNDIVRHDWMVYAYFRGHGLDWHIDSKPLMRYRIHGSNEVGGNLGFKALQKRLSMVKNRWYREQVESIGVLVNPDISLNRLFLIKNFWQLRRKSKEVLVLLFLLVFRIY